MNKNQKGVGTIVILILVVVVGVASFAVYSAASNDEQTAPTTIGRPSEPAVKVNEPKPAASYVDITEWGVRLAFDDADKVTYTVTNDAPNVPFAKSYAKLYLKQSVTTDENCRDLGATIARDSVTGSGDVSTKVGEYYYRPGGSPSACDGDPGGANGSINQLRQKIVGQQIGQNQLTITAL